MTSKLRIAFATLGLFAAASVACGGDGGSTGPSPSSLVGTWSATKLEMRSLADTSFHMNFIESGQTFTLWINEDHTWTSRQTSPGEPDAFESGTWSLDGKTLTIHDGETTDFRVSCDGHIMKLTTDGTWDYDFDGTAEPARISMEFEK